MPEALKIWLPAIRAGSGSDVFTMRLADGLRKAGHLPMVEWFPHRYEWMPWRLLHKPMPEGIDLIHANSWQAFAFRRFRIPLVVTEHMCSMHPELVVLRKPAQRLYHRHFIQPCTRLSYRCADALVAVSEHCAVVMRHLVDKPVRVISNWVDTQLFKPARERRTPGATFKLLFVGNPSPWKGADILPSLARELGSNFEIQCLGGLRHGFSGDAFPDNVKLLQRTVPERMPEVYRDVDAVLVPARYEAFGYVALEAMACGLPVVGFDCNGTAEVCVKDETALLAPLNDLQRLLDYCRRLAADDDLRIGMGEAGRQRALAVFDESRSVGSYVDIYRNLVERRRAHV